MLTLAVVLILGGLIIILGYALEDLVFWIDKRRKLHRHSRLEWVTNDILQLQRLAHEELGIGPWQGCANIHDVPTTEKGQLLAILDIRDPMHPRLRTPPSALTKPNGKLEAVVNSTENNGSSEQSFDDIEHSHSNDAQGLANHDQGHEYADHNNSCAEQNGGSNERDQGPSEQSGSYNDRSQSDDKQVSNSSD